MVTYKVFYDDVTAELEQKFGLTSDHQRYHDITSANVFTRKFADGKGSKNNIIMRIAWSACLWDSRRIAIAKTIADALNRNLENDIDKQYEADLKYKKSGY